MADGSRDGVALHRRCRATDEPDSVRKRRASAVFVDDNEESKDNKVDTGTGAELTAGEPANKAWFMISCWIEVSTLTKGLCLAIIVPSGVGPCDFTIAVGDGGQFLQLVIRWPKLLVDVLLMHHRKLCNPNSGLMPYHTSVIRFKSALGELRKMMFRLLLNLAEAKLSRGGERAILRPLYFQSL